VTAVYTFVMVVVADVRITLKAIRLAYVRTVVQPFKCLKKLDATRYLNVLIALLGAVVLTATFISTRIACRNDFIFPAAYRYTRLRCDNGA